MKNFFIPLLLLLFAACNSKQKEAVDTDVIYTCSMHPQVKKYEPGKCPICHMELIKVEEKADTTTALPMNMDTMHTNSIATSAMKMSHDIELTDEQIKLGGIQTAQIGGGEFGNAVVLNGTVTFNEKNIEIISARVKGRVEKLYFKNVGDYVPKGTPVYTLYSEDLNSAKQEYLLLLQQRDDNSAINYHQLINAAKHKLLLWGMAVDQINELATNGKASYTTTFYSTTGGYIKNLNITEGSYIMEGQSVMQIANLSTVWIEAQVYTSQLPHINNQGSVTVQIPALNKKVTGTIEFASPEVNPQTRVNLLRVNVPNEGNKLKPGMVAYVYLNNQQSSNTITLPLDAVVRTNNKAYVWIKTSTNKFAMQQVATGAENGSTIEIKQGLQPATNVVISGAYLLNSEYLLRNGISTMEGMNM